MAGAGVIRVRRAVLPADERGWIALRSALWPDEDGEGGGADEDAASADHAEDLREQVAEPERFLALLAFAEGHDAAIGLLEAALRTDYVNGTDSSPVVFLEGLYVAPGWRRHGVARQLVDEALVWARALGCEEIASDAPLDNVDSHRMHARLGFEETERVVYFRRRL